MKARRTIRISEAGEGSAPARDSGDAAASPPGDLAGLVSRILQCRICAEAATKPLPHAPRPILRVGTGRAPLWICGQAPGTRVHASGVPFTDASGDRLRDWLGLTPETFYDEGRVAIIPMGFCFPGQDDRGADLPPRRECAAAWHDRLFSLLPAPGLLVALGAPAQRYHLARLGRRDLLGASLGETVARWRTILEATGVMVLPHPSWRNTGWLRRHPWFEAELLPVLRERIGVIMRQGTGEDA